MRSRILSGPLFRITKVITATNVSIPALWKPVETVLIDGAVGGTGEVYGWTNNTGKQVLINYSIEVLSTIDATYTAYIMLNGITQHQVWYGNGLVSGTLIVSPGQTVTLNHYIMLTSYWKLTYLIQE